MMQRNGICLARILQKRTKVRPVRLNTEILEKAWLCPRDDSIGVPGWRMLTKLLPCSGDKNQFSVVTDEGKGEILCLFGKNCTQWDVNFYAYMYNKVST